MTDTEVIEKAIKIAVENGFYFRGHKITSYSVDLDNNSIVLNAKSTQKRWDLGFYGVFYNTDLGVSLFGARTSEKHMGELIKSDDKIDYLRDYLANNDK
jgi:ribosomal protein L30E